MFKIIFLAITAFLFLILIGAILNKFINISHIKLASSFKKLDYDDLLNPKTDEKGNYFFETDRDFKILQLTDLHIGAGWMTYKKDRMAINAVASMISEEKPDLVAVTGDIAFPVPYYSGTLNNSLAPKILARLMEQLGVYWIPVFGNHDTEIYSYFNREQIGNLYESSQYPHCLFKCGEKDLSGCGNSIINIKKSDGIISQSLVFLDSHSYMKGNEFGIKREYDNIKDDQVEFYKSNIEDVIDYNRQVIKNNNLPMPQNEIYTKGNSLVFFHIPLKEYKTAYDILKNDENQNEAELSYGEYAEKNSNVHFAVNRDNLFKAVESFNANSGLFCGHDHLNNCSLKYRGVRLTFGYSIDYTAYFRISKYGRHRGCTVIKVKNDSNFDVEGFNYYDSKYKGLNGYQKEKVSMQPYFKEN